MKTGIFYSATKLAALTALACTVACGDDSTVSTDGSSTGGEDSSTGDTPTTLPPPTTADSSGGDTMMGTDSTGGTTGDTTTGDTCGNGMIDAGEDCDDTDLDGEDCASQGFDGGRLACGADCTFDTSACTAAVCGDRVAEGTEVCDGADLLGEDCLTLGFDEGTLACARGCMEFDTSGCVMYSCGNDVIEGALEVCDGIDLAGQDCISQGFDEGTLACAGDCLGFDTSGCVMYSCGNDLIEGIEVCDGTDLGAATCETAGFPDGGVLACDASCMALDTSGCYECGNGVVDPAEACDDGNLMDGDGCSSTCAIELLGDTCGYAFFVDPTMLPYVDMGDTLLFNNDYGYSLGVCPGETGGWNSGAEDVVYEFTPDTTGVYTITFGGTWDSTVYIATDCSTIDTSCVAGADAEFSNDPPEEIVTQLDAGTTYFIIGGHYSNVTPGLGGPYTVTISDACIPSCGAAVCGDDGCGGSCGACGVGETCDTGACVTLVGDTCGAPHVIDALALPYSDVGDTLDYNDDYGYSSGVCPGETGGWNGGAEDVVYAFTPATSGTYHVEFLTTWDSTVYMVTDCSMVDATCVAGADNGNPEAFVVDLVAGTTYYIIGGHWSNSTLGSGGTYTLSVQEVIAGPGDTCADPIVIDPASLPYADSGNTLFYSDDYGYSAGVCPGETSGANAGAEDVVYSFTPTVSADYTFTFTTTWNSTVYLVTDCANVDGTCLAGDDNGNPEAVTASLTAGTTYYVIGGQVSNTTAGLGGPYDLMVVQNP